MIRQVVLVLKRSILCTLWGWIKDDHSAQHRTFRRGCKRCAPRESIHLCSLALILELMELIGEVCEVSHVLQSATRVQWGSRIKLECDIHRPKAGILPYCPPVSSSMAIEFIEHFPCSPMNFPCRWSHLGASPGGYFTVPSNFFKAGFSL